MVNKKNPKSQLQIGEIIAVLVVFFMLMLVGFVVYFNFIRSELETEKREAQDVGSVGVVQLLLSLPELQCSNNNIIEDNCVDKLKLEVAKNIIDSDKQHYFDLFGFSEVVVKQEYPVDENGAPIPEENRKWKIYENKITDAGGNDISSSSLRSFIPIIIKDPVGNKNSFGVLEITTYIR